MYNSILVIAAHPDDEILGCGGTIAKHINNGDIVNILIISEGETSRQENRDRSLSEDKLDMLSNSAKNASNVLGVNNLELLNLPDNRLDSLDRLDIIKIIEKKVEKYLPNIIYTHHSGDLNIDHQLINEATITATRPMPGNKVQTILSFETVSSTEWQFSNKEKVFYPNWFVDISSFWDKKKQALQAYKSEMREWPHPRSIKALEYLNHWRGSQIGTEYAEAFYVLRHLS